MKSNFFAFANCPSFVIIDDHLNYTTWLEIMCHLISIQPRIKGFLTKRRPIPKNIRLFLPSNCFAKEAQRSPCQKRSPTRIDCDSELELPPGASPFRHTFSSPHHRRCWYPPPHWDAGSRRSVASACLHLPSSR